MEAPRCGVSGLRKSVGVEVLLGAGVLVLAAMLVSTPPARATYSEPVQQTVVLASGGTADIQLTPAMGGSNTLRITVADGQGGRVAAEVTATLAMPSEQIGPLPVGLTTVGAAEYSTAAALLPRPGTELLELTSTHLEPGDEPPDPDDIARVAELVHALDGWLFTSGVSPSPVGWFVDDRGGPVPRAPGPSPTTIATVAVEGLLTRPDMAI